MKSITFSTLAIALALASAPVFADNHALTSSAERGSYNHAVSLPDKSGEWTIQQHNSRYDGGQITKRAERFIEQGASAAEAVAAVYEEAGAAFINIRVDQETRTIEVHEGSATITGPYAAYFPGAQVVDGVAIVQHVKRSSLEAFARRINDRARADFSRATIDVSVNNRAGARPGDVIVATSFEEVPDAKRYQGSLGYTNNGARYAGADLLTGSMRFQLGHGNELAVNAGRGLPNVREDSYGGRYNTAGAAFSHAGANGITRFAANHVDYKTGGLLQIFDITGKIDTISVFHTIPLNERWSVYGGLTATRATINLGAGGLDWSDTTSYRTATIGTTRQGKSTVLNVQVDRGVGGSRSTDVVPLLGTFDAHYWSVKSDFVGEKALGDNGWKGRVGAAAQISSSNTPGNELFTVGGPTRGQAFLGGAASGNRGYAAFAEIQAPERNGFTPYAGLDRSWVSPATGADLDLNSAYVGTRFKSPGKKVNFDVGYARSFGGTPEGLDKGRVFATATLNF